MIMARYNTLLYILILFCLGCSSALQSHRTHNDDNLAFMGYIEDESIRDKYIEAVSNAGLYDDKNKISKSLVILKYNSESNAYELVYIAKVPCYGDFNVNYDYDGTKIITFGTSRNIRGVNIANFTMSYSSKSGTSFDVSTNISLDDNCDILTVNKFGNINYQIRDFDIVLLFFN